MILRIGELKNVRIWKCVDVGIKKYKLIFSLFFLLLPIESYSCCDCISNKPSYMTDIEGYKQLKSYIARWEHKESKEKVVIFHSILNQEKEYLIIIHTYLYEPKETLKVEVRNIEKHLVASSICNELNCSDTLRFSVSKTYLYSTEFAIVNPKSNKCSCSNVIIYEKLD